MSTALAKVNSLKNTQNTGTDLLEEIADTWVSIVQENDAQLSLVSQLHQDAWLKTKKAYTEQLIILTESENLTDEAINSFVSMLTSNNHKAEEELRAEQARQNEEKLAREERAAEKKRLEEEAAMKRNQEAWRKKKILSGLKKLIK